MRYEMLLTDLDDTVLDSQMQISAENKKAVSEALAAGKKIVLCSGRSWQSLLPFEQALGLTVHGGYGIAFNGGMVYETDSRRKIYECLMGSALAGEVTEALKAMGAEAMLYAGDKLYAERLTPNIAKYQQKVRLEVTLVKHFSEVTEDANKIVIRAQNQVLRVLAEKMPPLFGERINMVFSSDNLLEFAHPDAHKGCALLFLARHLGISPEAIIAVGDQTNDVSMLQSAGLGVAVANAVPEAKAAADWVMPETNNENAVAGLIRQRLLADF